MIHNAKVQWLFGRHLLNIYCSHVQLELWQPHSFLTHIQAIDQSTYRELQL